MKILLRVAKEAKQYKWLLVLSGSSTLLLTAINLFAPRLMSEMTALVAAGVEQNELNIIIRLALMLLGLYATKILFRYLANFMAHKAAWQLVEQLRVKVYNKLQHLSMGFFRANETGALVSRTVNDTASFELLYAHLIPDSITNIVTVIGVTVILLFINTRLALLTCIPIPFILLSGRFFAKKVRPNFTEMAKANGRLSAQLVENYSGVQEIQAFGQQGASTVRVRGKASQLTVAMLRALNMSAIFHPSVEFLTALGTVIVVGFGGYFAYLNLLSVSDIVAFMLYLSLFYAPITGIAQLLESMQQAMAGAERIIEILDTPEEIADAPDATPLEGPLGELEFRHVSFHYTPEAPVLKDVSFDIKPGQMLAIVGATGVGKSTLAQLVARFYDPVEGEILLDGRPLRGIELHSLRKAVSMVLQDTFLFGGTIAENIAFAKPEATMEQIMAAAQAAHIHDEISGMPDGYQTIVGERGAKLSGGQKQRIAIARAILCEAPVLILDEATASVDVQTEHSIQQAIFDLSGTRTIIAIAHRLSTVKRADCIIVFEDGKIIQRGTHDELAAVPGLYQTMCDIQAEGAKLAL